MSPRNISLSLFPCHDGIESDATHLFAIFGKLLMFDMFQTRRNDTADVCCDSCLGIATNDPHDPHDGLNCSPCMPYFRPVLTKNISCEGGINHGINDVTHVIDASFMFYDTDLKTNLMNADGKFNLKSGFLPHTENEFMGVGDTISENPLVMAIYHVFLREYNELVDKMIEFGYENASEEAKKLLIGIFQHITYNEFLPMLLGVDTPLKSKTTGTRTYDNQKLPMVSHSFSLAYELVVASMLRESVQVAPDTNENLIDIISDATKVDDDTEMANLVKGMLEQASLEIGNKIPCDFRNNCNFSDVVATVTQDTRFYGIPPYIVWLATIYPLTNLSFKAFPYHDTNGRQLLETMYRSVFDVDFLSGMFTEKKNPNVKLSQTLMKQFEDQFSTLQEGDRYYYENVNAFQPNQLAEIRKVTMAQLLCRNVVNLDQVKQFAFDKTSPEVSCSSITQIDFCTYTGVSNVWTPFQGSFSQCDKIKIEYRTCQSTKPDLCPCEGDPFKIQSCPGEMITPDNIEKLADIMRYDQLMQYFLRQGEITDMEIRVHELYDMISVTK
ncbi:chorion peroxidase-like [Octopus sinensis]|uniref:Chorion peroxidase-like n=1 Tax=Octopus sinensis TaxID=2607531 RepID=A0A7E6FGA3_9MOLL|nr:chorion peroxidase-like [Octopus sinensis]